MKPSLFLPKGKGKMSIYAEDSNSDVDDVEEEVASIDSVGDDSDKDQDWKPSKDKHSKTVNIVTLLFLSGQWMHIFQEWHSYNQ